MDSELSQRAAVWSRYWSHGAEHSCGGSFEGNYDGELARYWLERFRRLPPHARVLDIATGNGPLPKLLMSVEDRADVRCDAVDLARIAPAWLAQLNAADRSRLTFHPDCAAETLPFPDDTFQLVVSQWGLEYSDLSRSVPELLRVLAPDGEVQLLLHHADALPVSLAAAEIAHIDWLCEPRGFVDTAIALIGPMSMARTPEGRARLQNDASANALRDRFNDLQTALKLRLEQACPDVLSEIRAAMGWVLTEGLARGQAGAEAAAATIKVGLDDSRLRLIELRRHALDQTAANALAAELAAQIGVHELQPVHERGELMGWGLRVIRSTS